MFDIILLILAGFAAGALNAVAGGGTFLSLPALIHVGIPPVAANASATLAALPGYVASAWAFRSEIGRSQGRFGVWPMILVSGIGSILGALLLIVTPGEVFLGVVPWLLLLATLAFALGPWILRALRRPEGREAGPMASALTLTGVSVYGGYFNGGLGIILLAALGLLGHSDMHRMNGLKNLLSAVLSLVSTAAFVAAGLIAWPQALLMAVAAMAGGYIGGRLSRRITRTGWLRAFVVLVGAVMTLLFFLRQA